MSKNLLIGNGVNAFLGINDLQSKMIRERFLENIAIFNPILQNLFDISINDTIIENIGNINNQSIETWAGQLYSSIKELSSKEWTANDEYRLQDVISTICLSSIFYTREGIVKYARNSSLEKVFYKYDHVYTLNYYEFWDKNNICSHLHGKINLNELPSVETKFISGDRFYLEEYVEAVKEIEEFYDTVKIKVNNLIFAPSSVNKKELVCVKGIVPSNNLYPSRDLIPCKGKDLYIELKSIDELDVFGVSPYGDVDLINTIKEMKKVKIYIYNMSQSTERLEWEKILSNEHSFADSEEFIWQ